jgi:hypothetical protein
MDGDKSYKTAFAAEVQATRAMTDEGKLPD